MVAVGGVFGSRSLLHGSRSLLHGSRSLLHGDLVSKEAYTNVKRDLY